jgi:undecaprenyl diphosphate synthase
MNRALHIAIIMDGNGRWAKQKGLSRIKGHQKGASIVQDITKEAINQGVKYLTLYAFSTENWNRPKSEVSALMNLFSKYLDKEGDFYIQNDVRFNVIGDLSKLSDKLQEKIAYIMEQTKGHKTLIQTLAVNYGAKDEIIRAVKKMVNTKDEINEDNITKNLDTYNLVDVDLMIRTGGYRRMSNYLLWQSAYAEMMFCDVLWPDFSADNLAQMIQDFSKIKRNFGAI